MPDKGRPLPVVVCRCCHRELFASGRVSDLLASLDRSRFSVLAVSDLCDLVERRDPLLSRLAGIEHLAVVACHPRAVRSLFEAVGISLPDSVRVLDMRSMSAGEIAGVLVGEAEALPRGAGCTPADFEAPSQSSDAWFPVIDRARCIDCGKCFDFCLFGAFAQTAEGTVVVADPAACKTNCPACARICPANAIIFPKSDDEAINGADLDEEALRGARIRLNPEDMLRGDVYRTLKARMAGKRRALFRRGIMDDSRPSGGGETGTPPDEEKGG